MLRFMAVLQAKSIVKFAQIASLRTDISRWISTGSVRFLHLAPERRED